MDNKTINQSVMHSTIMDINTINQSVIHGTIIDTNACMYNKYVLYGSMCYFTSLPYV